MKLKRKNKIKKTKKKFKFIAKSKIVKHNENEQKLSKCIDIYSTIVYLNVIQNKTKKKPKKQNKKKKEKKL